MCESNRVHTCSFLLVQDGICCACWDAGSPDAGANGGEPNSDGKEDGDWAVSHGVRSTVQVARRNARERRRVQAVNAAFNRLHDAVPVQFQSRLRESELAAGPTLSTSLKRVSKVATLRRAIDYIRLLQNALITNAHSSN